MNSEEFYPKSSIRFDCFALFGMIVAVLCCYWDIQNHDFIQLDDSVNFINNNKYLGFSTENIWWMLTSLHWGHWHPMTWFSVAVDQQIGQWLGYQVPNPVVIKLGNVLLHLVSASLIYFIARKLYLLIGTLSGFDITNERLLVGSWIGLLAAFMFIVHPQRVESVAWATERRDCLSTTFLLATFLVFLHNVQRPAMVKSVAAVLLYSASLLSKAWGITYPAVLIIFIVYFRFVAKSTKNESIEKTLDSRIHWSAVLPYIGLAIPTAILAISAQSESGALSQISFESRIQTAILSFGWYLWKLFYPIQLYPAYLQPVDFGWSTPGVWGGALILLLMVVFALNYLKSSPGFAVVCVCYLVILSPVSGLAQSGSQLVADRYGYVALIPVWIFIAWITVEFAAHTKRIHQYALTATYVALFSILTFLTHQQVKYWRNDQNLWEHAKTVDPENYLTLLNLGALSLDNENNEQAISYFREAFESAIAHQHASAISAAGNNLASVLKRVKNEEAAAEIYRQVLKWIPSDPAAIKGTIGLGENLNQYSLAQLKKLASNDPSDITIQAMLGQALIESGKYKEATDTLRKVIEMSGDDIDPKNLFNFGLCCQYQGRTRDAERIFTDVTQLDPKFISAFNQLGVLYMNSNRLLQATKAFKKVHELEPNHVNSHFNLGSVYLQQGNPAQAKLEFEKVIELADPNSKVYRAAASKIDSLGN